MFEHVYKNISYVLLLRSLCKMCQVKKRKKNPRYPSTDFKQLCYESYFASAPDLFIHAGQQSEVTQKYLQVSLSY